MDNALSAAAAACCQASDIVSRTDTKARGEAEELRCEIITARLAMNLSCDSGYLRFEGLRDQKGHYFVLRHTTSSLFLSRQLPLRSTRYPRGVTGHVAH